MFGYNNHAANSHDIPLDYYDPSLYTVPTASFPPQFLPLFRGETVKNASGEPSIVKFENFVFRLGGLDKWKELQALYLRGWSLTDMAGQFGYSRGQFSEQFNNSYILVPVPRPMITVHIKVMVARQSSIQQEDSDERIREAVNVVRLTESGGRRVESHTGKEL